MQILLTGAGGQLGTELDRQLANTRWSVRALPRSDLDIADPDQVSAALGSELTDIVINTAAYTAVDRAETEEQVAFRINRDGPAVLAEACAHHGAALIHLSTDYVFDGSKPAPYVETDPVCPANAYGRSKEAGERAVRNGLDRHVILRTAWVFGAHGRNFVKTMLRLAGERDRLKVVADQFGNPTATPDLARAVIAVGRAIEREPGNAALWGTYHCVNAGATSWRDFADTIVATAERRLGKRPPVDPITTADYPTPAARPANSRLDCTKLHGTFGITMPDWRDTLPSVIGEILDGAPAPSQGEQR